MSVKFIFFFIIYKIFDQCTPHSVLPLRTLCKLEVFVAMVVALLQSLITCDILSSIQLSVNVVYTTQYNAGNSSQLSEYANSVALHNQFVLKTGCARSTVASSPDRGLGNGLASIFRGKETMERGVSGCHSF